MQAVQGLPVPAEAETSREASASGRRLGPSKPIGSRDDAPTPEALVLSRLLAATSRGDRAAFARLYELTSARLYAVALRMTRRPALAEEVLQEAFLSVWERAEQHRFGRGSAFGWMVAVVRNRAIDRMRSDGRAPLETRPVVERDAGDASDGDEAMLVNCLTDAVHACLDELPANQRNAVLAAFFLGLSHEELARRLDVPLGTAKSWVRRGLRLLRERLVETPSERGRRRPTARPGDR